MEGSPCVNATACRTILRACEVPRTVPICTTTIAHTKAAGVLCGMECRMPSMLVCLLDVNLCACNAAHAVGIAVVV